MRTSKNRKKSPRKDLSVGIEVEFFVLNKEGGIAPGADDILTKASDRGGKHSSNLAKECAQNLVEVGSYPDAEEHNTMLSLIEGLESLLYAASETGYSVCPLGTYPGRFTPTLRRDAHYKVQEKLFGKNRFQIAGRCAGYHCHHTLPWGVYDTKKRVLKSLHDSKNQDSVVSAYNFLVAADPAFTTFTQSSPFYQGRYLAKDSRMLAYRGGDDLGYPKGLYAKLPHFGALPSYVHSGTDLIHQIEDRNREWGQALAGAGIAEKDWPKYRSVLDTNWTPVKVNAHGTLESRGMDMNHLPVLLSVAVVVRSVLRHVQENFLRVVPHDSAKNEPFALENKTIYIAPEAHVIKHLQKLSAYEGLANEEVFSYCKRLVALVKALEGDAVGRLLKPLETMLDERQTTSDKIVTLAKVLGHKDLVKPLPESIAKEIARSHSQQMFQDIVLMREMLEADYRLSL